MTTINPAECDRTTVYTGECRNFSDTMWLPFESGRRRSPNHPDGTPWLVDVGTGSFWVSDDKVRNLVPLVPATAGGQWTRELEGELWAAIRDELRREYPSATDHDHRKLDLAASASVDAVREKLNAHCPKPQPYDQGGVRGADSLLYRAERAERERDAAVARAEAAEARTAAAVSSADIEKAIQSCCIVRPYEDDVMYVAVAEVHESLCRAIEAGQAVDPVEEKARELYRAATPDARWETVADEYRRIAAHVLGQEADQ